ncbi:uncharacterized protein [Prorops nasuta]|uniref:uncharacterized protein n=1 Tax=Prorops nasuta TaxID=863751 RepID=UPI0034CEE936
MSVSDPLIKELKAYTRKFLEAKIEITDDNPNLILFCKCLETCLQKGVLVRLNSYGVQRPPEAWYCLEEVGNKFPRASYGFITSLDQVRQCEKVFTPIGQLRLLIKTCLARKCIHNPVELLVRTPSLAEEFYNANSIIGDEILGEILLSVLYQCSKLIFKLNLKNISFLDETWDLPECKMLELVPCKCLGISVCFIKEKALIINVQKSSVAAEDDKVSAGDVLDEINGNAITSKNKGKLNKIMKQAAGRPINLHIIKLKYTKNSEHYKPIVNLIQTLGPEYSKLLKDQSTSKQLIENGKHNKVEKKLSNSGFPVKYCGTILVGKEGDMKRIESSILSLIKSKSKFLIPARLECQELGIFITEEGSDRVIHKHKYMEISSCGRTAKIPKYFAYIAGETNCSVAKEFTAYIFFNENEDEIERILQSLGQGFQRTHFAV